MTKFGGQTSANLKKGQKYSTSAESRDKSAECRLRERKDGKSGRVPPRGKEGSDRSGGRGGLVRVKEWGVANDRP